MAYIEEVRRSIVMKLRKLDMLEITLAIRLIGMLLFTPKFTAFRYMDKYVKLPMNNGVWDMIFILIILNKLDVCLSNWDDFQNIISSVQYDVRNVHDVCVVGLNKRIINNEIITLDFINPLDSTRRLLKEALILVLKYNIRVMLCSTSENVFRMYQFRRHLNAVKDLVA